MGKCQSVMKRTDKTIREYKLIDHLYDINEIGVATDSFKILTSSGSRAIHF
jgi:hypothetical protein